MRDEKWLLAILLFMAGCIPAKTAPNLAGMPEAAVVVTGDVYDAGAFRVRYPAGWRVITSPAGASPFVMFAAPGDCALIVVSAQAMDAPELSSCEATAFEREARTVDIAGRTIHAAAAAAAAEWERTATALADVAGSVS